MNVPIIIPALRPGGQLITLIEQLSAAPLYRIILIDDESDPGSQEIFDACARSPQVHILRHASNLGKGAALKTGIRYVLESDAECHGVVTADADGQHHPEDILRVARSLERHPESL